MKKIITTIVLAIALLAGFGVSSAAAATPPIQNVTLTGVATCNADLTYSVRWTATGYPYNYTIAPDLRPISPVDSKINYLAWTHSSDKKSFTQFSIDGLSTSASAGATYTYTVRGVDYSGRVIGVVTLDGDCASIGTPPVAQRASQIHAAFKLYAKRHH